MISTAKMFTVFRAKMYLNFHSLFSTEVAQIDEILSHGRPGSTWLAQWSQNIWMLIKWQRKEPRPWFNNIKMSSFQYRKSHCGDKTVVRSSYLHNGISYTGKMISLYWIGAQSINNHGSDLVIPEYSCLSTRRIKTVKHTKFNQNIDISS